jgi:hypothetical protein
MNPVGCCIRFKDLSLLSFPFSLQLEYITGNGTIQEKSNQTGELQTSPMILTENKKFLFFSIIFKAPK